ncbi:MAG: hypothetical protein GY771_13175 [bacterium]|nr:hypothetical protein [bacterium]
MHKILDIPSREVKPERGTILAGQGVPAGEETPRNIRELLDTALQIFAETITPKGVYSTITAPAFRDVYRGEGNNESETPLEEITPKADTLALFAVTLGEAVCAKIEELFTSNEPALGYMLDAVASDGAERAADYIETYYFESFGTPDTTDVPGKILRYSPGYCGWHISGQRKLFDYLRPGDIGITLRPSYLMEPLKSVTGVFVIGPPEIHGFEPKYPFCRECTHRSCIDRQRSILG